MRPSPAAGEDLLGTLRIVVVVVGSLDPYGMPDAPSTRPAGSPALPASPARSAKKPTSKRGNASPGDGKKRGKK